MIHEDKLGRKIDVGDIVACGCSYTSNIYIGKVYGFGYDTVRFTLFRGKIDSSNWGRPEYQIEIESLLDEPDGWNKWTKDSQKKLLILKKRIKNV